jgi:hypothetical protein
MQSLNLHAVLFQEGDWWVGQWLEHDIAAQAKTLKELLPELFRTLAGHAFIDMKNGRKPFSNLKKAPDSFWTMYDKGWRITPSKTDIKIPTELPSIEPELHLVA